ncbi:MAG TPA: GNAT family N-acetyltransferase [Caulobacteraceae bacterium]|nr:GNAT family N-acetyltransferase [Caulobacteraceae bacterium]
MIETERLVLRRWSEADREPFVAMVTDPAVGNWLGGARTPEQAFADFDRMLAFWNAWGHGWLAVVPKGDGEVIGRVVCRRVPPEWKHPMKSVVEVGWALAREAWGYGYASEAAAAVLEWGFPTLGVSQIYAWTAATNLRSQAVMRRIGMTRAPEHDFEHPDLALDDPLRSHVVYVAARQ